MEPSPSCLVMLAGWHTLSGILSLMLGGQDSEPRAWAHLDCIQQASLLATH